MATRKRKIRKKRGTRTVGYGRVGQHRKHGDKGGRGKAGLHKHKWSWTVKYAPDYFGKHGFKPPTSIEIGKWVNVSDLDGLSERLKTKKVKEGLRVLDLKSMGIDKLLGAGEVKGAYYVIVDRATKKAKEKVEKAGGKVQLLAEK